MSATIESLGVEAAQRLSSGEDRAAVARDFSARGVPSDLTSRHCGTIDRELQSAKARANLLWGVIIGGIGLVVTGATYAAADPGGTFVVAWGALAIGGWKLHQGMFGFITSR